MDLRKFGLWRSGAVVGICCLCFAQDTPGPPKTLAIFQLSESFGVPWPEQPIEFRYDNGRPPAGTTRMIGPGGTEVPYQWVTSCSDATATNGCILVRSGLPRNAHYAWTLQSGSAPAAPVINPAKIAETGGNYEITNGLTGIRIVSPTANPKPWNRAPIQGIQLRGGAWTGVGRAPNFLYAEGPSMTGAIGASLQTPMSSATGYKVTITEPGPLKTVVKATYTFNRPHYTVGPLEVNPAGPGHYTLTATLYADSKSVLIDEDSDMQFSYYLPLYAELMPDQIRYRGHDSVDGSGGNDPPCGYEGVLPVRGASQTIPIVVDAPGKVSNGQRVLIEGVQGNPAANGNYFAKTSGYPNGSFGLFLNPELSKPVAGTGAYTGGGTAKPAYQGDIDGFLDMTYTADRPASYLCSAGSYRKLLTNYPPAAHAAGWYVMMYRAGAGPNGPVVGFYIGRASQQSHDAIGPSTPGPYSSNAHWISHARDAGIQVDNLLRGPDARTTPLVHRNWGIWVGRQADLLPTQAHQQINDEQNAFGGINLSRLYTFQLSYPDPPGGWKWLYLSSKAADQLISWVRNGTPVCGSVNCYYDVLYHSETSPWGRAILDMWKGNSTAAVQTALDGAVRVGALISANLALGGNHFGRPGYYELGLNTSPETAVINAILMDRNTTAPQKATAKAALALFGCLFWDNDWFPIENSSGEGSGLSNQIQQYFQYRAQSVAAAPSQPYLMSKVATAAEYAKSDFAQYFSPSGAGAASTHYQSAFFEPLILSYMALSQTGALSMTDPKWAAYANWELSIQTPPEPRFGNVRKGYSNGDGNTEGDVRTGMLATALYPANPTVAGYLMWAWRQSNSATQVTEDSQFVTTLVTIDPTVPPVMPSMGSINIPGYHSAERHAFGTPYETALWFINGGFYSPDGHRHNDDGQVTIYAHSAPLAIDWNANLYNPSTSGRFMHNSIVLDSELPHPWSDDKPSLQDASFFLRNPTNTEFAAFKDSTTSTATFTEADGTVWTRTVRTLDFNQAYPIISVYDSFSGASAPAGKTLTWNMMASGPVATPSGPFAPLARFSSGCQAPAGQLPSNGPVLTLPPGLQHFNFTGASWAQHASRGINWDLFTLSGTAQQFLIGNWGHGCHTTRESTEYQAVNGTPFAEIQDILRIHGGGPFTTLILPYRKSETPTRTVTQQACGVQIVQGAETSCFNSSVATYVNASTKVLTVFDGSTQSDLGLMVTGGPQEVVMRQNEVRWTIAGMRPGLRRLTLPGTWTPNQTVPVSGVTYSYNYPGGAQTAPVTIIFSSTPPK